MRCRRSGLLPASLVSMRDMYAYVEQLIEQKRQALETLHRQQILSEISENEASSCRRAILEGIEELATLLRNMETRRDHGNRSPQIVVGLGSLLMRGEIFATGHQVH